jgi:predicted glycosyltransferase
MTKQTNVYLLSQHSLGVGHLNRTSLLAGEMAKIPGVCVTHISGGPPTGILSPHPGVSFVELPPLIVSGFRSTDLVSIEKEKTKEDIEKERVHIIRNMIDKRHPDLFITEFFPFSPHRLDGTVMPVLNHIRDKYPQCGIVCSSRDIPICHGEVLTAERVRYINSILDNYYDLLLIHGDPTITTLSEIPSLRKLRPLCPVIYTGYIAERRNARSHSSRTEERVLVTIGGGRDGHHIIECAIKVAEHNKEYKFDLVCGPFMEEERVKELKIRVARFTNAHVHRYIPNLKEIVSSYDLVICPGGYNTLVETIVRRRKCISIPRKNSYEQRKRVNLFSAKGLLQQIPESRLTASRLARIMKNMLNSRCTPVVRINSEGLKNTVDILQRWMSPSFLGNTVMQLE